MGLSSQTYLRKHDCVSTHVICLLILLGIYKTLTGITIPKTETMTILVERADCTY